MLLVFACLLAASAAAPASYDQRQDGDFNVRADVQNVVFVVAIPQKIPNSIFSLFKSAKDNHHEPLLQERADVQVMEAFVEPSTPYKVEIGGSSDRYADGDGRAVEVVIAGRRRLETEPQERDELKLLGATEQCGPDRERDPVTLTCRFPSKSDSISVAEPDVAAPASSDNKLEIPPVPPTPEVVKS